MYATWNPAAPRSALNFNPFETFEGNSPDCSGYYPGEVRWTTMGPLVLLLLRQLPATASTTQAHNHTRLSPRFPASFSPRSSVLNRAGTRTRSAGT